MYKITNSCVLILKWCIFIVNCTKKADINACTSWGAGHCNVYGNVPTDCPHMCNLCPSKYRNVQRYCLSMLSYMLTLLFVTFI